MKIVIFIIIILVFVGGVCVIVLTETMKSNLNTLFIFSVDIDNKYIDVLTAVEEAKNEALKGGNCAKYNW